jgi:hypothetical protein
MKGSFKVDANGLTDKEKLWLRLESDTDQVEAYARNEVAEADKAVARFALFINESELEAAAVAANTSLSWPQKIRKLKEIGNLLQYQFSRYANEEARAYHYLKYLGPQDPLQVATGNITPLLAGADVFTASDQVAQLAKEIKLYGKASEATGKDLTKLQGQLKTTQSLVHRAQLVVGALAIGQGAIAANAANGADAAMNQLITTMIAMKLIDAGMNAGADVARAFGASDNQVNTGLYWASFALLAVLPEEGAEEEALAGKVGKPGEGIANNPNNIQLKLFAEEDAPLKAAEVEKNPVIDEIGGQSKGPAAATVATGGSGLPASVAKNVFGNAPPQVIQDVQAQLMSIRDTAVSNVKAGKGLAVNEPWAKKLATMQPGDKMYDATFGSAVHEEAFELIKAEKAARRLPQNLVTNTGVPQPDFDLPGSHKPRIADIRLSLGNGKEAVWDITTKAEAGALKGHVDPYAAPSFVDYAADLPYER